MTSESGDVPDWVMKVNRADRHIRDLNAKITAFLAPGLYELVPMRSPDRQGLTLKVHTDLPAELGLVVGDALHNLRSGLDTRIVAVAEQLFGALTEKQEAALFLPVVDDEVTLIERTRAWPKLFGGDAGQLLHVAAASRATRHSRATGQSGMAPINLNKSASITLQLPSGWRA